MKTPLIIVTILILFSCGREPSTSDLSENEVKKLDPSIALMGDSISTGVFASTQLGDWPNELDTYLGHLVQGLKFKWQPEELIQNINEAADKAVDKREVERRATSTSEDWGLRREIADMHNLKLTTDVPYFLRAKSGAGVGMIPEFTEMLRKDYSEVSKEFRPGYLVVMLGGNNFCGRDTRKTFRAKVREGLNIVADNHPDTRIVVAPIPPLLAIRELDHDYKIVAEIGKIKIQEGLSAKEMRTSYCKQLYIDGADERWSEFNRIIAEETEIIGSERKAKRLDIRLASGIATMKIERKHLSFDGFHPSKEGQKLIAEHLRAALR